MNKYRCLKKQRHQINNYELIPIREEDIQLIKNWRNDQMDILRQKEYLSEQDQISYFNNVIRKNFDENNPEQILFSFLFNDNCIGYGGLVHINWESKRGEISFLAKTQRAKNPEIYKKDFRNFLKIISIIAFEEVGFNCVFTETFDIRPYHISLLERFGFKLEGRKSQHILINGKNMDSLIHEYTRENYVKK